ncbi:MAG TPA: hypothetical protein ENI87_03910 [bacterium]|nr:hypothetical protein [bacterium]
MTKTAPYLSASLLLVAGLWTGCSTAHTAPASAASPAALPRAFQAEELPAFAPRTVAQDAMPSIAQVHPPTMITLGAAYGEQTNEVNTGNIDANNPPTGVLTSSASSVRGRLRAEHYFDSGIGVMFEGFVGSADDIEEDLGATSSSYDSTGVFLGAAFRATMDDDFRLPVRFGPFLRRSERTNNLSTLGTLVRETIGLRLSAAPEWILSQSNHDGRISELSVFGEVQVGVGPASVSNDSWDEDAYAFTFDYEVGVRYRFAFGLLTSLSWIGSKYHVGTSESYQQAVFFGIDDDFTGVMVTAGVRF